MKLTVVIPVYRVERTLDRCVASVLRQDVDDMEVILVDDGSPDQCPARCDHWAASDARIKVIHQANGGLSKARNAAIAQARGQYITFVDSDDWVADGTYAALLERMADSDITEYPIAGQLQLAPHTYSSADEYWLDTKAYTHTYACNKVYRTTLFSHVRYPEGKIFEDAWTLPLLLRQARKISTSDRGCYHYTSNPEGITATCSGDGLAQLLEAHLTHGMPINDDYYLHLLNIQMDVCERTGAPPVLPRRKIDSSRLKGVRKLKAIALNKLGIKTLCTFSKFIHHFKKPTPL